MDGGRTNHQYVYMVFVFIATFVLNSINCHNLQDNSIQISDARLDCVKIHSNYETCLQNLSLITLTTLCLVSSAAIQQEKATHTRTKDYPVIFGCTPVVVNQLQHASRISFGS